jgi:pimeloyl-ACP methyl ester carboxylesterase
MNVEFVRFKATDDVELQGWLTNQPGELAVLHIHGMSGNGYENYFLDNLREAYSQKNISFFAIDTRGAGIISEFRHNGKSKLGGSCYEIFEESEHDIAGALEYLKSIGKNKIILQGHSLGCTKVVNFVLKNSRHDIEKVILLAPTDMVGWAKTDVHHDEYLAKAKELISGGRGHELTGSQCWLDKTPISAQTYPTICEPGSSADIYGVKDGKSMLGSVSQPQLIAYGDEDIGIKEIYGDISNWQKRAESIKNSNTTISIIRGAPHSFRNYEKQLSQTINEFIY